MLLAGACVALLAVGWYLFAPSQLGGRSAYVTTTGTSMEPLLHAGDLVLVRTATGYHVGDVVAYHNPDIDEVVLHRIVGIDGDRFVMKGDNNSWLDSYQPAEPDMIGTMAGHVPAIGRPLGAVRTPWGMSAVVSMAALGIVGGRRRARRNQAGEASAAREDSPSGRAQKERAGTPSHKPRRISANAQAVLAALAALALVLGGILFLLPPTTMQERDITYQHLGTFEYTGRVSEAGVKVYGRETLQTGEPVYLELVDQIRVTFDYVFESDSARTASGTVGMVAVISDINGWNRTIDLAPSASFDGAKTSVSGDLDLRELQGITSELERLTGVTRDHYTVAVRPTVSIDGTLDGIPLSKTFAPELRFTLDPTQLQLEPAGAAPPGAEEALDPLNPVFGDLLKTQVEVPRSFSMFGLRLQLEPLRTGVLVVLVVAVFGLIFFQLGRSRTARRGEAAVIESKYGPWLVPVHPGGGAPSGRSVQVEDFDSLVRLATHYGHVVLHEERDGLHTYSVEENGVTYRYLVQNGVRPS
jgi:signal peptidase I